VSGHLCVLGVSIVPISTILIFDFRQCFSFYCAVIEFDQPFIDTFVVINGFVTRVTRRVPYVEQELLTLPEHLSSLPAFRGVLVARSLVFCGL